ncbi:unnamed protein product, partial [Rotaria sp. Silwood2]
SFKTWYNATFGHNENCGQILDFDDMGGPLCICSHRPLQCANAQWSLSHTIAYTFHEKPYTGSRDFSECLVITKLSTAKKRKLELPTGP